jgi:hypothetical protein
LERPSADFAWLNADRNAGLGVTEPDREFVDELPKFSEVLCFFLQTFMSLK